MEHHLHELPGTGKSGETESRQEAGEAGRKDRVTGGLLQLGGRDSYFQFHKVVKNLGLVFFKGKVYVYGLYFNNSIFMESLHLYLSSKASHRISWQQ